MSGRSPYGRGWSGSLRRLLCGLRSVLLTAAFPFGRWYRPGAARLLTAERFNRGWTIILPGIVGHSTLNENLARGLAAGGVDTAIEVFDWTGGWLFLFPYYLRRERLNRERARELALRISEYQRKYPGRPVHLLGHSGGAGIALWVLEHVASADGGEVPAGSRGEAENAPGRVTTVTLLGAAVSQGYDASRVAGRTTGGLWNFYSPLDVFFLSFVTLVIGSMDGCHCVSAGLLGFSCPEGPRLHQIRYHPSWIRQFHWGGHFSYTNEVFAAERIAPSLTRHAWGEYVGARGGADAAQEQQPDRESNA